MEEHVQSPTKTTSILSLLCAFLHGLSQPCFLRKLYYYPGLVTGNSRFTQSLCDRCEGLDRYVTGLGQRWIGETFSWKGFKDLHMWCTDYYDVPGTSDLNPNPWSLPEALMWHTHTCMYFQSLQLQNLWSNIVFPRYNKCKTYTATQQSHCVKGPQLFYQGWVLAVKSMPVCWNTTSTRLQDVATNVFAFASKATSTDI